MYRIPIYPNANNTPIFLDFKNQKDKDWYIKREWKDTIQQRKRYMSSCVEDITKTKSDFNKARCIHAAKMGFKPSPRDGNIWVRKLEVTNEEGTIA